MSAEDAGAITAEIRLKLDQMDKDALAAQKRIDEFAKKLASQGKTAGRGFAGGMKQGFDNVDANAARLGRSIGRSLAPQMLLLQAGIKLVMGIGSAFKDAFMSNEKFAESINTLKSSLGQSFTAATRPVTDFFANLIERAARSVRQTKEVEAALRRLREENFTVADKGFATALELAANDFVALNDAYEIAKRQYNSALSTFLDHYQILKDMDRETYESELRWVFAFDKVPKAVLIAMIERSDKSTDSEKQE